jgi:subtilisin family serine protease
MQPMTTVRLGSLDFDLPPSDDCWHLDEPRDVEIRRGRAGKPEGLEEEQARYVKGESADQEASKGSGGPKKEDEDNPTIDAYTRVGINARAAWEHTKGKGVKVVIFDNGVDFQHPSLQRNVILGDARDFDQDSKGRSHQRGGRIDNRFNAHGTACAGVVAAADLEGVRVVGVAPEADLMPIRISTNLETKSLINALEHARRVGDIILIPRYLPKSQELSDKISAIAQELPIVCASGNDGTGWLVFPACLPETIAVGACNEKGYRSTYSQYGADLDVVAPSNDLAVEDASVVRLDLDEVNIRVRAEEERLARLANEPPPRSRPRDFRELMPLSQEKGWNLDRSGSLSIATTDNTGDFGYNDEPPGDFCLATGDVGFGGTSAAAAQVAGVVALMLSACFAKHDREVVKKCLTPATLRRILKMTTYKNLHPELPRRTFEVEFGAGLVNAAAAVEAALAEVQAATGQSEGGTPLSTAPKDVVTAES